MPEWLQGVTISPTPVHAGTMAVRIAISLVLGLAVAGVYRMTHGGRSRDAGTLAATIVLLAGLLAMVSMVIGESVARAFGLVGALSIVRFRTVVEDTRDTAFVIFAVIVGMAVGTGLLAVALVGVPLVSLAAFALSPRESPRMPVRSRSLVTVRLGLGREPGLITAELMKRCRSVRITGARTVRQGSSVEVLYECEFDEGRAAAIVLELNAIEGVQEVQVEPANGPGVER